MSWCSQVVLICLRQLSNCHCAGEPGNEPLAAKVGAAMLTSGIGITVAQPSDVLKVSHVLAQRLQLLRNFRRLAQGRMSVCLSELHITCTFGLRQVRFQAHNSITGERPYSTAFHGYRTIYREEGFIRGLYRGCAPAALDTRSDLVKWQTHKTSSCICRYGPNLIRNIAISSTVGQSPSGDFHCIAQCPSGLQLWRFGHVLHLGKTIAWPIAGNRVL